MNARTLGEVLLVWLMVAGLGGPQPAPAATQADQEPLVVDVVLGDGGVMVGQVVDGQGQPLAGSDVSLFVAGRPIGTAKSDRRGLFAFRGLQGGVYHLAAAGGQAIYRAWVSGTAPPNARRAALVVAGEDLARGQLFGGPGLFGGFGGLGALGNLGAMAGTGPIFAGMVATAVTVPVAVHNADQGFVLPTSP